MGGGFVKIVGDPCYSNARMRALGVMLSFAIVGVFTGAAGYYTADRIRVEEVTRLTQERDNGFIRERELRGQLENALAERAALAQEALRLQANLSERLQRLESLAEQLASEEKKQSESGGGE